MDNDFETVQYYIQQENWQDTHPAILRLSKRLGGSLTGHYWDRRASEWRQSDDVLRRYWNGFDPDVERASEEEAQERIRGLAPISEP